MPYESGRYLFDLKAAIRAECHRTSVIYQWSPDKTSVTFQFQGEKQDVDEAMRLLKQHVHTVKVCDFNLHSNWSEMLHCTNQHWTSKARPCRGSTYGSFLPNKISNLLYLHVQTICFHYKVNVF